MHACVSSAHPERLNLNPRCHLVRRAEREADAKIHALAAQWEGKVKTAGRAAEEVL